MPFLSNTPVTDLKPVLQTPLAETIMNQYSIVILSSISIPKDASLSELERDGWKRRETAKIFDFRAKLQKSCDIKNAQITLAMDQTYTTDWWACSLLHHANLVVVLLNKAILDYVESPQTSPDNNDDRHTRVVAQSIRGMLMCGKPNQVYILYRTKEGECDMQSVFPLIKPLLFKINNDDELKKFANDMKKQEFNFLERNLTEGDLLKSFNLQISRVESYYMRYLKEINKRKEMLECEKSYVDIKLYRTKLTDSDKDNTLAEGGDSLGHLMTNEIFDIDPKSWLGKKILIQGLAGSGKTELSQVFRCRWAGENSLKQFKMVFCIEINNLNYNRQIIDLVPFIPYQKDDEKKQLMSTISRSANVLLILDFVYLPCNEKKIPIMSIFESFTCAVLSLTRPLQNEFKDDSNRDKFINLMDFNYSIKGFDMQQLMEFFRRRNCDFQAMSRVYNQEIYLEICKLPVYAVILCQSINNSTPAQQTREQQEAKSKEICQENTFTTLYKSLIEKIVSMHSKVDFSLDKIDQHPAIKSKFVNVCLIAWDLAFNLQSPNSTIQENDTRSLVNDCTNRYEDSLGLFEFINKNNKTYIYFSMQSIQYFLAAYTYVVIHSLPDVKTFLTPLPAAHYINSMWRFVIGLLKTPEKKNQILLALSRTYILPKLIIIQAIAESRLHKDQVSDDLIKEMDSLLVGAGRWKTKIYSSDSFAIMKSFDYLPKAMRVKAYDKITTISFTQCDLESESMFHLIVHLSKLKKITILNFSRNESFGNPLTSKGCLGYLREIIRNNTGCLTDIYLSKCGLTQYSMKILKSTLCMLSSVCLIDLSKNPEIGENGWRIFSEVLPSIKSLNKIHIAFNKISIENLDRILKNMISFHRLKLLNLSGNSINDTIMKLIVNLLEICPELCRLYLSDCNIDNNLLNILAAHFQRESFSTEALVSLNLSDNKFKQFSLPQFLKSLLSIKRLQNLTLDNNSSSDPVSIRAMANLLDSHSQLKDVSMSNCGIDDTGALTLSAVVERTQVTLSLKRNPGISQSCVLTKSIIRSPEHTYYSLQF